MKDTSGAQVLGRTSWKRLGLVMVPTVIAAGALSVMMANGAIAASFAVSGTQFKLTASTITGNGFVQYGTVDQDAKGKAYAAAVSAFATADITKLCQSVIQSTPIGDVTLTITAGTGSQPVHAEDLIIDMSQLNAGEADFGTLSIGQDASTLGGSAAGAKGQVGGFGQQASTANLTNVQQTAYSTNAGKFQLHDMSLNVSMGDHPCY